MNLIEFIFKLLWQFINFEPGRFETLKEKAAKWKADKEAEEAAEALKNPEFKPKWYRRLFKYDNEWWFQVGLAIFFLFAFKSVRAWLMSDPVESHDDDDYGEDDGEDDVRPLRPKKVQMADFKL